MAELLSPPQFTRQQRVSLQEQTFPRLFKMSEFVGVLQEQLQIGATFPSITDCMAVVCANSVASMKPYKFAKQNKIEGSLRARCLTKGCPWHIYFHAQLGDSSRIWTLTKMHLQHSDSCSCAFQDYPQNPAYPKKILCYALVDIVRSEQKVQTSELQRWLQEYIPWELKPWFVTNTKKAAQALDSISTAQMVTDSSLSYFRPQPWYWICGNIQLLACCCNDILLINPDDLSSFLDDKTKFEVWWKPILNAQKAIKKLNAIKQLVF